MDNGIMLPAFNPQGVLVLQSVIINRDFNLGEKLYHSAAYLQTKM